MDDENQQIEVKFVNGDRYIGRFKSEQFHGEGEYHFANGNKYIGNFLSGEFCGKGTYYDTSNDLTIEAKYSQSEPINPVRIINNQEGSEYYGDVKEGLRDGRGIFKFPKQFASNSPSVYEGSFKDNKFHGKGKLHWDHGASYDGDFFEGEITGKGTYIDDDCRYEGEYLNGRKHGKGIMLYKKTGELYKGEFRHDKKEGQGIYTYKDKSVYEGMFSDDKKNGRGELVFGNGMKYSGTFREGVFSGKGVLTLDGATYEGDFKENLAEGEGTIEFANGNKMVAQFKQNMKMGPVSLYVNEKGKSLRFKGEFSFNVEQVDSSDFGPRF